MREGEVELNSQEMDRNRKKTGRYKMKTKKEVKTKKKIPSSLN